MAPTVSELPLLPRFGPRPSVEQARQQPERWRRRYRLHRVALFISLPVCALFGWLAEVERQSDKRKEGTFYHNGQITADDHKTQNGSLFDFWFVDLKVGETLRARLWTKESRLYLSVVGPTAAAEPKVLARGKESSPTTAALECSPTQSGEYLIYVMAPAGVVGAYELTTNRPIRSELTGDETGGIAEALGGLVTLLLLMQYAGLFLFLHWRNPDRILLLRPFQERRVSRALKHLNRRYLAYRGFTFTLADKHLKHSLSAFLLANIPLDFGSLAVVFYRPLFRLLQRRVYISRPRDLTLLQSRLRSRFRLTNFWSNWLGLGDRINKFRSTDELWQQCISVLLDNCQVVIVDMSHARTGTLWEVQQIALRHFGYKTVFIVRDDEAEGTAARGALEYAEARDPTNPNQLPVLHRYDSNTGRFTNPTLFEDAYSAAVSSQDQPTPAPLPVSIKAIVAVAGFCVLGPFWIPVGLVLGILALRDIKRAQGLLKGELLAHCAICVFVLAAMMFLMLSVLPWVLAHK